MSKMKILGLLEAQARTMRAIAGGIRGFLFRLQTLFTVIFSSLRFISEEEDRTEHCVTERSVPKDNTICVKYVCSQLRAHFQRTACLDQR